MRLTLDRQELQPGGGVSIKLEANDGEQFKGFIIQARNVENKDEQVS